MLLSSYISVCGEPCVHALKVAYTFPGYTGLTYKDYSVRWWKKYYHLVPQCGTLDPQVMEISKSMMLLHHQEICGLHIGGITISKIGFPT